MQMFLKYVFHHQGRQFIILQLYRVYRSFISIHEQVVVQQARSFSMTTA